MGYDTLSELKEFLYHQVREQEPSKVLYDCRGMNIL